ncbi:DUF11 domain-containing protein [Pseudarthrobacter sp. J64]|uniref:DUF11 domain-containing protein n=1 Tax=Pseudarthrobacter sp. J64 TaxID=3116485 RepID=UPI002E7FCEDF|nr:DUF11 domain-containing protein [Pseudarthrobacter sp. J64]MEE2569546.1 DUF11 domain-containing protein [Pseudarthrobacter sp. J64]
MRHAVPRRRLQRRGFITFLTAVVLAVAGPFGLAAPAFAAIPGHTAGGEFTSFAIDGNRAGPNDWNAPYGPGLTPQGRPTTGILDLSQNADDVCGPGTETSYTGKLNDNPWTLSVSNVNTKDDICSGGSAYEVVNVDGQYHYVLYQSMARDPQGSGDMSMLSILEGPIAGRSDDVLLEFDFAPNTGTASLTSYRWNGSEWIESAPLIAFDWAQGPNPDYPDANPATFIEYAVDLTANNLLGDGTNPDSPCGAFTVAGMLTRTGNSIQAELQDRFAFTDPVVINNCSSIDISKVASPAVESDAVFTYELNQSDGAQVYSSNLLVSGGGALKEPLANNMIRSDIQIGDTHTWSNVIAEPDYQLRETVLPDGWQLMNITCTWYNPFTGQTVPPTIVYQNDDPATPANEAIDIDFQIPPSSVSGMQTSCVITNRTSGLVVVKAGAGDTNVPFAFTATGKPGFNLTLGDTSDVLNYTPGTSVTIAETVPVDTPSWAYAGATCVTPGQPDQVFSPQVAVTVTTVAGQVTTCTFTNNQAGQIVVEKDGRGKTPTDTFGFDASYIPGSPDFSLMIGQSNTSPELAPGEYTIAELLTAANETYDPDYALVNIACTITTAGAGTSSATGYVQGNLSTTVTLAAGDIVTCTFTNDQQGRLIVKKSTTLRDGTFSFDGRDAQNTQVLTGSITTVNNVTETGDELSAEVNPGTYSVTESTAEQFWTKVSATCMDGTEPLAGTTFDPATGLLSGIAIDPGHIVTCTFNNAKQTADVRVAKTLTPATDPGLFDLSINGNVVSPAAGVGNGYVSETVEVVLGESVTVGEAAHTGTNMALYTSVLVCDNGIAPADNTGTSGNFVVTSPDVTVTCTFQNTRKSAELTLTKAWVNGLAGDTASLTASGSSGLATEATGSSTAPDTTSPAVLTIYAGETVTLGEALGAANGASYTAALACTPADGLSYQPLALTGTYEVPATPVPVTCTFTNTRTSAVVTLQKHWTNAAAGDTADLDITATLGQTPADGATSTADGAAQFTDTTNVVTANVLSGETVQLAEVLGAGNVGAYSSSLSCNAAGLDPEPTPGTTGSYTMPKTAAPVTCTFTNNRTSVELVLEKEWINGAAGDAAELAVTSTLPGVPETSVSSGIAGSEVDSPVKTVTVLSGETVGLSETLDAGNEAAYATSLVCSVAASYQPGALTGSLVVPKDATTGITCRWINEAGRGTIVIVKNVEGADGTFDFSGDWTDPVSGDPVNNFSLTTDGGTASQTWSGVVVPKDGSPFTVTEFDPTPEYDGTALTCVGSLEGDTSSATGMVGTIDLDPGQTVTCTYTNTQRSSIVIIKDAVPNDDQDFVFTATGSGLPESFMLDDDADATLSNTFTSALLPANQVYTVDETAVAGWTLDLQASMCSNQAPVTADGVSLTPAPGQTITCTFVNRAAPGTVTVTKTVEGVADDYAWEFDIAISPVETGVVSPQTVSGTGDGTDSVTFEPLVLNKQYTITEPGLPVGWTQSDFTCVGLTDEDAELAGFQFTVTVPGQAISCSLANTATPGEVEVTKTVTGVMEDFEWSIPFTINPVPAGQDATQNATTADPTVGWTGLLTGEEYTLTEQVPDGWTGGAITCTVTHADNTTDNVEGTFTIEAGDSVACAVTNEVLPGELTIIKNTVGGNGEFDFTITGEENGVETERTITTVDGTGSTTVPLVPGVTYTVTEVNPGSGWTMGDFVCTLNEETVTVPFTVGADDDISCSITNTAKGRIIIVKNARSAEDTPPTFGFDGSWTSGSPALVDGGFSIETSPIADPMPEGPNVSGQAMFVDVTPGSYTVTEDDTMPEYSSRIVQCTDGEHNVVSSGVDGPTKTGNINVDPGETVTCVFENTQTATVIVDKVTVPATDMTEFEFEWFLQASEFGEDFTLTGAQDPKVFTGVNPDQDWGLRELAKDGWRFLGVECTLDGETFDGATIEGATVGLDPEPGDVITCTFTNGKRGPVVIEKDVTSGPVKNADGSYTVTYDVTVTSGSSVTEQYTLDDELAFGGGITVVSATVASSDAAVNAAWNGTAVTAVTTGSTTINPGATHTFTVTTTSTIAPATGSEARNCTLGEGETGTGFLNTAELTVTDGPGGEAEACVPAPDEADVSIVKTGTQKVQLPATGGSARIDYTLTVSNAGPTAARDVVVTDTLPAEVKAETVSSSVGTCTNSTTTFTCTLGLVEVGQTITITVVASISNYNGNGPFTNVATVTTSTPETKTENNKSVHVTTVERAALAVTGAGFGQWLWPATALILTGALLVVAVRPKRRRGYRVA